MHHLVIGFAQNLTLPLAIVFCYAGLLRFRARGQWWAKASIPQGILFGIGAVLCMFMPLPISEGISIDNRIATVALAGPFAGPVGAVIATLLAAGYRAWLGGIGAWAGIASLVSAGLLGCFVGYRWSVAAGRFTLLHCLGLGLGTVAVSLPWTWALPASVDHFAIFSAFALPVTVMYPFATMVLGGLLLQTIRHHHLASELSESEGRFRELFAQAPDAIFIADPTTGILLDVNPRGCELIQRPRASIIGMHQSDLHPHEDAETVKSQFDQHRRENEARLATTPLQSRLICSDGSVILVEVVASTMNLNGKAAIVGIFRDIRERERAAKAVQDAQAMTDRIVATADACILGLDAQGRITLFNPALERLTGYQFAEVHNKDWQQIFLPRDHLLQTADEFHLLLTTGSPRAIEGGIRAKDGTILHVAWRCSVVNDPQVDARVLAVGIDMSTQRSMEERIRQSEKMQAIGQLAGGLAHDFNNQLQIISGYASLLEAGLAGDRGPLVIRNILDGCKRAADLTHKLLVFSRKASVRRDLIDMVAITQDVSSLIKAALGASIILDCSLPDQPCIVIGDPSSLQNILLNLGLNARDAMPDGGTLRIHMSIDTPDPVVIKNRGFEIADKPCCRIDISDTGIGMDKALLDRIFEPFFTTKPLGKGTGLGLAAVYGTVQEHGGAVTVQSQPGVGTTFTLWLPLAKIQSLAAIPSSRSAEPDAPNQTIPLRFIVLIDDEEPIRDLTTVALEHEGFAPLAFADGTTALAWFTKHGDQAALAIIDMHLPGISGTHITEAILAQYPDLPIIISTGHGPDVLPEHLQSHAGVSLLSKPYPLSELIAHVRRRLA